jgi:hypothetical protein
MNHIKKFESFTMNKAFCDRCHGRTDGVTTTSKFNLDTICMSCKDDEKKDPEYDASCQLDNEEIRKGNYNFEGSMPNYTPIPKR